MWNTVLDHLRLRNLSSFEVLQVATGSYTLICERGLLQFPFCFALFQSEPFFILQYLLIVCVCIVF